MVEIAGQLVLWQIMKIYANQGFKELAIALNSKREVIKDYFLNYHYRVSSLVIQLNTNEVTVHDSQWED